MREPLDAIPRAAVVSADGVTSGAKQSARGAPSVSTSAIATPEALARELTQFKRELDTVRQKVDANPAQAPVTFEDVAVAGSGTVTLHHGLNRRVRWRVVDWVSTIGGTMYVLERNATDTDANNLVLDTNVAGTVSIEVY